jgi:hypothetical protein
MPKYILTFIFFVVCSAAAAQSGYQYNGATGKYEYNTDPLGGIAQRYQNYTNMQIGTLQRMNNNLLANTQATISTSGGTDVIADVKLAVARGKMVIAAGKATNIFKWSFTNESTEAQKKMAAVIKSVIQQQGLNVNDYCEVKAFFAVTFYAVFTGASSEYRLEKKAECLRTKQQYLTNEYVQGMNNEQKTDNVLGDINILAQIKTAGLTTAKARGIAANALLGRGFSHPDNLKITAKGLQDIGEEIIATGKAKTTFIRSATNMYVKLMLDAKKVSAQQAEAWQKYLNEFDGLLKKIKGPDNDHAFAQSVLFSIYYSIHNNSKMLTPVQWESVMQLFYKDILGSKEYQLAADSKLQLMYEKLAIECMELSDRYARQTAVKYAFEKKIADPKIDGLEKMSLTMNNKVYDELKSIQELAYIKLKEFFRPRNYDEYELKENGFEKK